MVRQRTEQRCEGLRQVIKRFGHTRGGSQSNFEASSGNVGYGHTYESRTRSSHVARTKQGHSSRNMGPKTRLFSGVQVSVARAHFAWKSRPRLSWPTMRHSSPRMFLASTPMQGRKPSAQVACAILDDKTRRQRWPRCEATTCTPKTGMARTHHLGM